MKKIFFVIVGFLCCFCFAGKAYAWVGVTCDINDSPAELADCTKVTVSDLTNISNLNLIPYLEIIEFEKVNISDISFLNGIENLNQLMFTNASVNLKNFTLQVPNISMKFTHIYNDDFSALANNKLLESLYVTSSFVFDLSSLAKLNTLPNFTNLSLNENAVTIIDLTPIMSLPNISNLGLINLEHNVTSEFINWVNSKSITVSSNISSGPTVMSRLKQIINNLNLAGLSDEDIIRKITLYVVNNMEYGAGNSGLTTLENALNGVGVCAHYASFQNTLLNLTGFASFEISGYVDAMNPSNSNHAWNNVYLNGSWLGLDPTWLDTPSSISALNNKTTTPYFLANLQGAFKNDHFGYNFAINEIIPPFKVNFITNNGSNIQTQIINGYNKLGTINYPNIAGYYFNNWYYDSAFKNIFSLETKISKSMTLYGKWLTKETSSEENPVEVENPKTGVSLPYLLFIFGTIVAITLYLVVSKKKLFYKI